MSESDDGRIPTTQQMRNIVTHLQEFLDALEMPVETEDDAYGKKFELTGSIRGLEASVTCPPHYQEHGTGRSITVMGWVPSTQIGLASIRTISRKILTRWGLTRYADLPPYPDNAGGRAGDPIPDGELEVEFDERSSLLKAQEILQRNHLRYAPSPETADQNPKSKTLGRPRKDRPIDRKIMDLHKQGLSSKDIAQQVGRPLNEVSNVIDKHKKREKRGKG